MKKTTTMRVNYEELDLLYEAIDMLQTDYPEGHPNLELILKITMKIVTASNRVKENNDE